MNNIEKVSPKMIVEHLDKLGNGNCYGNIVELGLYPGAFGFNYYLVEITESAFYGLVFQHSTSLSGLVPDPQDRPLKIAAQNALIVLLSKQKLNSNWDLEDIVKKTTEWLDKSIPLPALALRDSRGSELETGKWYLQDGCHRALGYAMVMQRDGLVYKPVKAYIATKTILNIK